ncbi:MAG: hypothetical protein LBT84_02750, partial [Spirochaetia bacterium]|jgi:hypothetical protein|nr:hypothetical protein [Spirochaetia bacterium]
MNGDQTIIQNPQDVLKMDITIEHHQRLNKKKIFEAIYLCYCFSSAFVFRLGARGDLSGNLEFSDEDKSAFSKLPESTTPPQEPALNEEEKSILDELEDLI